jgi:caa(3)-type oxidase subunit IV
MSSETHSHTKSHDAHDDVTSHVKLYKAIGISLLVLTVVTVAASYLEVPVAPAILIALIIASFKGYLVAGHFMHLTSEKKIIYFILILTMIFFAALMILPAASMKNELGGS